MSRCVNLCWSTGYCYSKDIRKYEEKHQSWDNTKQTSQLLKQVQYLPFHKERFWKCEIICIFVESVCLCVLSKCEPKRLRSAVMNITTPAKFTFSNPLNLLQHICILWCPSRLHWWCDSVGAVSYSGVCKKSEWSYKLLLSYKLFI